MYYDVESSHGRRLRPPADHNQAAGSSTNYTDRASPEAVAIGKRADAFSKQLHQENKPLNKTEPTQGEGSYQKSVSDDGRTLDSSVFTDQVSDKTYMAFAQKI